LPTPVAFKILDVDVAACAATNPSIPAAINNPLTSSARPKSPSNHPLKPLLPSAKKPIPLHHPLAFPISTWAGWVLDSSIRFRSF
ncbi:unnamed protein product, partial [Urochloa humidicola]